MKKLIYHNLKIVQNIMIGFFLWSFVVGLFFFTPVGSGYFSSLMFTVFMIQTLHFNLDKNKGENILVSFPITRKQIVLAQYVSTFIITLINTLTLLCVSTIQYLLDPSRSYPDFDYAIFMFVITLFHLFLYLPFYFRFGYKNRFFFLIPFLTIFIVFAGSYVIFDVFGIFDVEITPKEFVVQNRLWFILGSVFLLTIVGLFSLSYSVHVYKKREF